MRSTSVDNMSVAEMESSDNCVRIYNATPLSRPHAQIRLLRLRNWSEDTSEPLAYDLSVHDIGEAPSYDAISYAWGDPLDAPCPITVNGSILWVGRNCKAALWQAGNFGSKIVWIDSACINQEFLEEKSVQVGIMYTIFTNARRVLACIGEADEGSERLVRLVGEIQDVVERENVELHPRKEGYGRDYPEEWIWNYWATLKEFEYGTSRSEVWIDWAKWKRHEFRVGICRNYNALLRREYFQRLWVVQEIYAGGSNVHFLVGRSGISLQLLRHMHSAIFAAHIMSASVAPIPHFATLDIFRVIGQFGTSSPLRHLRLTRLLLCHDPRDRIYATSGMLKEYPGYKTKPLLPDYTKSAFALAVELAERHRTEINREDSLNLEQMHSIVEALDIRLHDPQLAPFLISHGSTAAVSHSQPSTWSRDVKWECMLNRIELYGNQHQDEEEQWLAWNTVEPPENTHPDAEKFRDCCKHAQRSLLRGFGTSDGDNYEFLVPPTARLGDTVHVLRYEPSTGDPICLVSRKDPKTRDVYIIGFAALLAKTNLRAMREPDDRYLFKDRSSQVVLEMSVEEMILLVTPLGESPIHARLLFHPPKLVAVVTQSDEMGVVDPVDPLRQRMRRREMRLRELSRVDGRV